MERPGLPDDAAARLAWPLRLTRAGLVYERAARAFWPFATVLLTIAALLLSGVIAALPLWAGRMAVGLLGAGGLAALAVGLRWYRPPGRAEALARLDATLPGQPIAALADAQAIGVEDPGSQAVWQAHRERMAARLSGVRAPRPEAGLPRRDPFALRLIALNAAAAAAFFGVRAQSGDLAALLPGGARSAQVAETSWEGWIEAPSYTGKPTLYLGDQPPGTLAVPVGSRVTLRFYGKLGAIEVAESFSRTPPAEPVPTRLFKIDHDGVLAIGGDRWAVTAIPDAPPRIQPDGELVRTIAGEMRLPFRTTDDYGVSAGRARITLDLDRVDRRYGLATAPEPRPAIVVDLPMPFRGDRTEIADLLVENLSEHPWAELPVVVTLTATDAAGQSGDSAPVEIILPGRRFLNPLARAIVEQRRDILWSMGNARRAARILRAMSNRPEGLFAKDILYLKLRTAAATLGDPGLMPEGRDTVAGALWDIAVEIEDGDLADSLEQLRRAQERLSEAMRQGATPEELSELMQDYRQAMRDYARQLGQQAPGENGQAQADAGERMEVSPEDLQAMMDRIEDLMQQGRMAEAQEMLDRLQTMMENMEVAEGQPGANGPSPGEQAMEDLRDTLRAQQGLSDEAFQNLQNHGDPDARAGESTGETGPDGGRGQGESDTGQGGGNLADRQRGLESQLDRQRETLPGAGTPEGEAARDALDRAGRAMGDAAEALDGGDTSGALDRQAEAMEALREGMRDLDDAMQRAAQSRQPGQQGQTAGQPGERQRPDPLGRNPGGAGAAATDSPLEGGEDVYRRAQELMEELRRRSGETERPDLEREYLKRLLDLF